MSIDRTDVAFTQPASTLKGYQRFNTINNDPGALGVSAFRLGAQIQVQFTKSVINNAALTTAAYYVFQTVPPGATVPTVTSVTPSLNHVLLTLSTSLKAGTYTLIVSALAATASDDNTVLSSDKVVTIPVQFDGGGSAFNTGFN
jgi:hypothetical protein